jgi:hypothetical protein
MPVFRMASQSAVMHRPVQRTGEVRFGGLDCELDSRYPDSFPSAPSPVNTFKQLESRTWAATRCRNR